MFRDQPADARQHVPEVRQIQAAHWLPARRAELEHHQPRTRPEYPRRLPEPRIEVHEIAHPEPHRGPVERCVFEGETQCIGRDRLHSRRLRRAEDEHRRNKIGRHHVTGKAFAVAELRREIERTSTEVKVTTDGHPLPTKLVHRGATPATIGVERQDVIEHVVARSDLVEDAAHVLSLGVPSRDR